MNTNTISKHIVMGALMSSLLLGALAFIPQYAHAATTRTTTRTPKTLSTTTLTCMQTAVDTREDAVAAAFSNFNMHITDGLTARKSALHDAWGLPDGTARSTAVKKAWSDWKTAKSKAYSTLKSDRKSVWDTFKNTAKNTCKETIPKEETAGSDTSGTTAL